jgi:hypothetical protein
MKSIVAKFALEASELLKAPENGGEQEDGLWG